MIDALAVGRYSVHPPPSARARRLAAEACADAQTIAASAGRVREACRDHPPALPAACDTFRAIECEAREIEIRAGHIADATKGVLSAA